MANTFHMSTRSARQLGLIDDLTTSAAAARSGEAGKPAGASPVRPFLGVVKPSAEDLFDQQLRFHVERGLKCIRQLQFAKAELGRRWAFDFAFPDYQVAVEVEGLVPIVMWRAKLIGPQPVMNARGYVDNVESVARTPAVLGRHASVTGIIEDMEKYNSAALLGWTVLRFAAKNVKPRHAIDFTLRVLAARGWRG